MKPACILCWLYGIASWFKLSLPNCNDWVCCWVISKHVGKAPSLSFNSLIRRVRVRVRVKLKRSFSGTCLLAYQWANMGFFYILNLKQNYESFGYCAPKQSVVWFSNTPLHFMLVFGWLTLEKLVCGVLHLALDALFLPCKRVNLLWPFKDWLYCVLFLSWQLRNNPVISGRRE